MVKPQSALIDHLTPVSAHTSGVTLQEVYPFSLLQIAAWPDTIGSAGQIAAQMTGCGSAPDPGLSATGSKGSLLRIEPLKWWLVSETPIDTTSDIRSDTGALLDLSHSRSWIRVSGDHSETLLNNFLPLDLRTGTFPEGTVATTAFHHVGVTLWRRTEGYDLLLPRSFAAALFEMLSESALQYGLIVQ